METIARDIAENRKYVGPLTDVWSYYKLIDSPKAEELFTVRSLSALVNYFVYLDIKIFNFTDFFSQEIS